MAITYITATGVDGTVAWPRHLMQAFRTSHFSIEPHLVGHPFNRIFLTYVIKQYYVTLKTNITFFALSIVHLINYNNLD